MMMVYCPIVPGVNKLNTYGTLDIGEVPNNALVITAILNAFTSTEQKNNVYLLTICFLLICCIYTSAKLTIIR